MPAPVACAYNGARTGGRPIEVTIVRVSPTESEAGALLAEVGESLPWRPIPGVADEAIGDAAIPGTIFARVGRVLLTVRARDYPGLPNLAREAARSTMAQTSVSPFPHRGRPPTSSRLPPPGLKHSYTGAGPQARGAGQAELIAVSSARASRR